jgi:hypothetical protein
VTDIVDRLCAMQDALLSVPVVIEQDEWLDTLAEAAGAIIQCRALHPEPDVCLRPYTADDDRWHDAAAFQQLTERSE